MNKKLLFQLCSRQSRLELRPKPFCFEGNVALALIEWNAEARDSQCS